MLTARSLLVARQPARRNPHTAVQGTPEQIALAKELARRFSVDEGLLVTDGSLETEMRTYGDSAQSFSAFDSATDLVRIVTDSQRNRTQSIRTMPKASSGAHRSA